MDLLNLRKADLVFSAAPVVSATLSCILFRELTPLLACRQDHPFQKSSVSTDDLKNLDMVSHLTGDEMIYQRKRSLLATLKNAQIVLETNSILMLLTLLSETDCIGFITQDAFMRYQDIFKLRQLTPLFPVPQINVYLVYRKELERKASFMQFLKAMQNN